MTAFFPFGLILWLIVFGFVYFHSQSPFYLLKGRWSYRIVRFFIAPPVVIISFVLIWVCGMMMFSILAEPFDPNWINNLY